VYRKSQLNEDNQQHMLLKQRVLAGIVEGRIRLAFRRWKRPTVKAGGSLRTVVGVLAIEAVDLVTEAKITKQEASHAGYSSREELLAELQTRTEGKLYRIALRFAGADPRHELRQQDDLSKQEIVDVKSRLNRMDVRSRQGPWTTTTLKLIATNPGKLAAELAESIGMEKKPFKANVRKLKELGLTESLKIGYRLSPRGKAVFKGLAT
jgi:hypothetical protein